MFALLYLSAMTCCHDDVCRMEGSCLFTPIRLLARNSDVPFLRSGGIARRGDGGRHPDVQLEKLGIAIKEFCKFVLWCEDRPVRGKGDVRHVVVPDENLA